MAKMNLRLYIEKPLGFSFGLDSKKNVLLFFITLLHKKFSQF